ncbi:MULTISPECIES: hypothetical protein [Streptomyces]|uniref:Uncharacterized protein n=1 Tax=Streptomyces galilaeus TaxID=33899 RepID=A0ABW9IPN4_STRGJ
MLTATARAEWMALQVFISAKEDNGRAVTHDLVDAVMSRDADKEQGKANKETVRWIIRKQAASEGVRVIFTDDERYWTIREQLHHMSGDAVQAMRNEIAEGGHDDPRAWDKVLVDAISVHLSNRVPPARLWGCAPVSIRLWTEPRRPAVEEQPASIEKPAPADDVKARCRAVGFAAKWWAEQHTEEPTDEALRATFTHCVKPPRPELYPVIRETIAAEMPPAAAAPLFAALAAHEAVRDASLSQSPHDLHAVVCHMETLPFAAPISLHPELREARDAAEEAWQALRTADSLTARNAAHDKARTAVERAGAVILAVAPHAHRMHGTDMPATADGIRAAALAYNAVDGAPEELSAVETGMPTVRVRCRSDSGTGWTVTATITAGVDSSVGHIPAHPPIVVKFRKRDGRQDAAANARRVFGALLRVDVPVAYDLDRRP